MDRIFRLFARFAALLLVLLPIASPAEDKSAPPPVRPALWKVVDKDTTIYLFGTVHVLPPGIPWYDGKVAAAFEGSQELVTEIVDTDPTKTTMMQWAALSGNETLRGMLSPPEKAAYEGALAKLGIPAQAFDGYEPWLAAMILSVAPLAEAGFRPENGVDEALSSKAKTRGLAHGALETYEYQMTLFDSLPLETQKFYLAQVIKDLPTVREQIEQMTEAWKRGDADTLAKVMNAQEDYPGMFEMLLTNRNKNWANWVQDRMKRPGTVFLAVGAGHLAGPGSLQEQLDARGIKAERVQ
jgi:uncharacterized protein YbaP (TraB family)